MKLILASNNMDKLREFRQILPEYEIIPQREAGFELDVEETGETFEENAYLKAAAAAEASGLPAISDDSGICVDALDGAPGIHSARFAGEHVTSGEEMCAFLLHKMEGEEHRTARFVSCICCVFPDGTRVESRGECEGKILHEARGTGGFGYDPVFEADEAPGRSTAELSPEEKNAVSHRGKALRLFREKLVSLKLI